MRLTPWETYRLPSHVRRDPATLLWASDRLLDEGTPEAKIAARHMRKIVAQFYVKALHPSATFLDVLVSSVGPGDCLVGWSLFAGTDTLQVSSAENETLDIIVRCLLAPEGLQQETLAYFAGNPDRRMPDIDDPSVAIPAVNRFGCTFRPHELARLLQGRTGDAVKFMLYGVTRPEPSAWTTYPALLAHLGH